MILYVNGDSHTAAAEAVNPHAFAEDDGKLYHLGRAPHPENLAVSWGNVLSQQLQAGFYCDAESASSNDRILRTTKRWIQSNPNDLNSSLLILQWSTWEREEWLIDGNYYQVNASGIDIVPESHQRQYKEYIANVNWQQKTQEAHLKIWNFHLWLKSRNIKHVFFNGNNDFSNITNPQDWETSYISPYDSNSTYDAILKQKYDTVSPTSYHYGAEAHRYWAEYILQYLLDKQLV